MKFADNFAQRSRLSSVMVAKYYILPEHASGGLFGGLLRSSIDDWRIHYDVILQGLLNPCKFPSMKTTTFLGNSRPQRRRDANNGEKGDRSGR